MDEEDRGDPNLPVELLNFHCRIGHWSLRKLQIVAERGILPRELAKCKTPVSSSCLYASMNRRPRSHRSKNNINEEEDPSNTVDILLTENIKYPILRLIYQMIGLLTTKIYQYKTVYVDQASRLSYAYPQKMAS